MTGDALYCDDAVCTAVTDANGERERSEPIMIVKENQATLLRAITTLFASRADATLSAASLPPWELREATTVDKGHGRVEVRHLVASTALNDYLDWPGVAQVLMIERIWWERGERHEAARYAITSLPPAVADARRLLADRERAALRQGCHAGRGSQSDPQRQRAERDGDPARHGGQRAASGGLADDRRAATLL